MYAADHSKTLPNPSLLQPLCSIHNILRSLGFWLQECVPKWQQAHKASIILKLQSRRLGPAGALLLRKRQQLLLSKNQGLQEHRQKLQGMCCHTASVCWRRAASKCIAICAYQPLHCALLDAVAMWGHVCTHIG